MKIALAHFRVGETDGVSLEMAKWRSVLEEIGHRVYYISGTPDYGEIYIPELNYRHPENLRFVVNGYDQMNDFPDEDSFKHNLMAFAEKIEKQLEQVIRNYDIQLLIPNNIWSLGWGLPAGVAFARLVDKLNLPCIAHHHDFYWERERYSQPNYSCVDEILQKYFPPQSKLISHVVINKIAQAELKERRGINSTVIPNVFDFRQGLWETDQFNQDFRARFGIGDSDLVVLQATRVAERKAIELAIELISELEDKRSEIIGPLYNGRNFSEKSRIILLMVGLLEANHNYLEFLKELAKKRGVEIIWANSLIKAQRTELMKDKFYSLWDAYAIADLITYPSILEGWGNQFLEGLFAKKPMVVFEYPVYQSDIKELGFSVVSLGSTYQFQQNGYIQIPPEKITTAARDLIPYLKDHKYRQQVVENNFSLGGKYLSFRVLRNLLEDLLTKQNIFN